MSQTLPLRPPLPQHERAAEVGETESGSERLELGLDAAVESINSQPSTAVV